MNEYRDLYEWARVRCEKCQYWREGLSGTGQCKRRAPNGNGFAITVSDNWCGEFMPRSEMFVSK